MAVRSGLVRFTRIGSSGQSSSPSGMGTSRNSRGLFSPWPNQSWFWNWIQQPARTLSEVAGLKVSRLSSLVLTSRGLGSMKAGMGSTAVASAGALRPKREPTRPMSGSVGSWRAPS